ncbi:ThuA domain-containing protein [bacterium]|nr:ThuA domain-containing protein [bacterium]
MKKILMVWGGWAGHEPQQCVEAVAEVLRGENCEVEVSDTLDSFRDLERLKTFDCLVPCWTMGQIEKEQFQPLRDAVKSGVGLAGWHGGMGDAFRVNTEFQWMVGGQFVCHPGGIKAYRVEIVDHDDPITRGLSDFDMKSEQYYMHVDPANEVLATTTFHTPDVPWADGTLMPVVWKRSWGQGKVFYSSLGHVEKDFEGPEVMEITKRGTLWACR